MNSSDESLKSFAKSFLSVSSPLPPISSSLKELSSNASNAENAAGFLPCLTA
jgi:hypothetical protein